jgi:serine/threonine protein kinase/cytochrome c-type biogenesis protein CcmH/NrfG
MIGRTISHYCVEAELGRGGMGVVYRARDQWLERDVALKLLPEQFATQADRRARILAEARAASALNHPGITTIYEVGEDGEQLFIVMELLQGKTLRATMVSGAMEPRGLVRLGAQVAEALAAAHARNILHGDVKPENIYVLADGRVKLLDFGIARQFAQETLTLTRGATPAGPLQESQVAGTLAYMAPEQLRGDAGDARSDLFSLGVVLYEMAAGRRPFPGPTATALAAQILQDVPVQLGAAEAGVPAELERIVHKLLAKEPETRYQSAREVQVDLANLGRALELGAVLPAAGTGKRAVAVLPFKLLTPNPEDDYLSVALADAVINELSASGELLVRPTSTVQRYAKQPVDPLLAARELNVQVIVDGSIQKFAAKLRVHVQAWNAADGSSLLSAKHDSDMADLFALQDKIAASLARALGAPQAAAARAAAEPPTKNPLAYELFLRASERLSRVNRWDTHTAIDMLENAVKLDPHFADGWARLADAYVFMGGTFEPVPVWFRRGEQAMRRALALDPENALAHCARGRVLWTPVKGFQNRTALRALGRALHISPGCHPALVWRCLILLHVGLLEEAREGLVEALATHPDDNFSLTFLGQTILFQGKYDEAGEFFARALTFDSGSLWANIFYPMVPLYGGKPEDAAEKIRAARQIVPGDALLTSWEALLWAKRGEMRKAEQTVRRAISAGKSVLHTHHMMHTAAAVYAAIGKPAQAVRLLRQARRTGLPNYPLFRDDPHFRPLAAHPPFRRLLAELKREWEGYRRDFARL